MEKIKVGVIFGGMSTENEVSVVSAGSILGNIDRKKFEVFPIYIDKQGKWYIFIEDGKKRELGAEVENIIEIENIEEYLQKLDVVFPVLHGLYGEDGTIQGLFELLKIPYVAVIGESEAEHGTVSLKNMVSGEQEELTVEEVIERF